jgi:Flp pilus assembly protein TadG
MEQENKMRGFTKFLKAEAGNMAVMFSLAIVPLIVAGGAAIDFGQYTAAQTQIQAALDAGTLAAAVAKDKSNADRIKIGTAAFNANMTADTKAIPHFDVQNETVVASASVAVPTSFMAIVGINTMDIGVAAEVKIPENKNAEIALVLDYSGSMGDMAGAEIKYVAMRKAATKLIDDISKGNTNKVKFALVPFSHHVYTSLPKNDVLNQSGGGMWTGCTQDRQYPYNLTDAAPSNNASKWGQPDAPDHSYYGCNGYAAHGLKLRPLTSDFTSLKSQITSMTPYAYTHVALGVEFGYQVLSPNGAFTEGAKYSDQKTQKYMIVLTDGAQTEPAFGPGGSRTVAQGDSNLEALCDNAKKSGITMLTVAFDLDDSSQRARLKNCATDAAEGFFMANDTTQMAAAFQAITTAISAQVFVSK